MTRFFALWNNVKSEEHKMPEKMSKVLVNVNESFKIFLTSCSWFVYLIAGILIICCVYYYIYDCKRRIELRRRRQEVQRANERIPQRRRPGAVYRDHEIFRNVMKTVRQYIDPTENKNNNSKHYVLRRTRSGAIYGRFADQDVTN